MKTFKEQAQSPTFSKDRIALMFYILETSQQGNADVKTNADRAFQYAPYYKILKDMYNDKPTNLSDDEVNFLNTVNKTVDKMIDNGKLYQRDLKKANQVIANAKIMQENKTPSKLNKVLEEYILKNTGEKFEETPFGQIVVDEINKAVSEVSEIKLALDYLTEQEDAELESQVGELGRQYATAALNRVRGEMIEKLPQMVEEILADIMTQMDSNE